MQYLYHPLFGLLAYGEIFQFIKACKSESPHSIKKGGVCVLT